MATNGSNKPMGIGQRPKQEYEKKLVGLVEVVTSKTKAKFTLTEDGKTFKNGETSITVNLEDLPSYPRLKTEVKEPKNYRIRMSQDGSEIEAIQPAMGHFKSKLIDLGKKDGEDADPVPFPKEFKDKDGKVIDSHLEFFAVYKIIEGQFKGVQLPAFYLHYKFEEDLPAHPGFTRFAGNFENKKATRLFQLYDWGKVHGIWSGREDDEPIEWDDDTILPELLFRATKNNDRVVDLTIKDGYIRELIPVETDEDEIDPLTDTPSFMDDDLDTVLEESVNKPVKVNGKKAVKAKAKEFVKKISSKVADEEDDL